jgi:hypothetical protein
VTRSMLRMPSKDRPLLEVFSAARRGPPERLSIAQIEQIRRTARGTPLCGATHKGAYVE